MKNIIFILMALVLICVLSSGCATARRVELDEEGKIITETKIVYPIWGARKTKGLDINMKEGKISLGSIDRDGGAVGETMKNISETLLITAKTGAKVTGVPVP